MGIRGKQILTAALLALSLAGSLAASPSLLESPWRKLEFHARKKVVFTGRVDYSVERGIVDSEGPHRGRQVVIIRTESTARAFGKKIMESLAG